MNFEGLLSEVAKVPSEEKRAREPDYMEIVVAGAGLKTVTSLLETYFGPPFKPPGARPSGEAARFAESHGGLRREQTLYLRCNASGSEAAMLWPWGGGTPVTVKLIRQ